MVAIAYVVWTLVPVVIVVMFSFNAGKAQTAWQGFSITRWYTGDVNSVFQDEALRAALFQSLKLAGVVVLLAVPLGVAFAIGLDRWRGRGSGTTNFVMIFSFITPETAIGVGLFLMVTQLVTGLGLGFHSQVLGLVMYELAYTVIIVRARLLAIGRDYEEAAMDLGASPTQSLRRVLLPLLLPAILASVAIVFAASIDNFVVLPAPVRVGVVPDDPDRHLLVGATIALAVAERPREHHLVRVDADDRARVRRRPADDRGRRERGRRMSGSSSIRDLLCVDPDGGAVSRPASTPAARRASRNRRPLTPSRHPRRGSGRPAGAPLRRGPVPALVVLQAMDTGGKDGTIEQIVGTMDRPASTSPTFKKPSEEGSPTTSRRINGASPPPGRS